VQSSRRDARAREEISMANRVAVRELRSDEFVEAIEVIARGMRDNPLHIQALGADPEARIAGLKRIFGNVLPVISRKGVLLGAFCGGELVGVTGMLSPRNCQPTPLEMLTLLPKILSTVGARSFGRVGRWLHEWRKHDPSEPHWHLGPVAVDAHLQGRGIGSAMMVECCVLIDREHAVGYLETDKRVNVGFYEKFGFQILAKSTVLNVPNWFMRRSVPRQRSRI
jgi:GNAT superfamily N-acetyltransferase